MAARSVVIASVAAPVVRRVIPGRALPEGVTPESEGSILAWLQSHVGKVFLGPRAECFGALGILIAPYAWPSTGLKPVHGYG